VLPLLVVLLPIGCDRGARSSGEPDASTTPQQGAPGDTAASSPLPVAGWSLDSAEIVVGAEVEGDLELFLARGRADSAWVRLTDSPGIDRGAVWAPSGAWLAFESERAGGAGSGDLDVWGLAWGAPAAETGADTAGARPDPVVLARSPGVDGSVAVSPDGLRIAFHSTRADTSVPDGTSGHIWLARATVPDGGAASTSRLTRDPIPHSGGLAWHPGGDDLFISRGFAPTGPADIVLLSADGSRERTLVSDGSRNVDPRPSPDGTRLAWTALAAGTGRIAVAAIDGTAPRVVASGYFRLTGWTPDGAWLVTDRRVDGRTEVWLISPDGSGAPEPLFPSGRPASGAAFRPTSTGDPAGSTKGVSPGRTAPDSPGTAPR